MCGHQQGGHLPGSPKGPLAACTVPGELWGRSQQNNPPFVGQQAHCSTTGLVPARNFRLPHVRQLCEVRTMSSIEGGSQRPDD